MHSSGKWLTQITTMLFYNKRKLFLALKTPRFLEDMVHIYYVGARALITDWPDQDHR